MVTHTLLREWWRGIGEKEQYPMSQMGRQLAFKYKDRKYKVAHHPHNCEFRFNGLFKLKRWHSYCITDAEINVIGGIEHFEKMIDIINDESKMGRDFYPKFEFAVIKHDNAIELARLC